MRDLYDLGKPVVQQLGLLVDASPVLPGNSGSTPEPHAGAYYPETVVVQGVLPTKKRAGSTAAMAKAYTPFALARSGGTPGAAVTTTRGASRRKPPRASVGRELDGPACIGCLHYRTIFTGGCITGHGHCVPLEEPVRANNRRPCGLYQFYGSDEGRLTAAKQHDGQRT